MTHDYCFLIDMTFIGFTVTDAWKAWRTGISRKRKQLSILEFADQMAWDCIHNKLLDAKEAAYLIGEGPPSLIDAQSAS